MAQQKPTGTIQKQNHRRGDYVVAEDQNVTQQKSGKFITQKMFEFGRFVLEDRAIPDHRDGHIPVQRRLLYSMYELQPNPGGNYLKVARVTGHNMGLYHPHGPAGGPLVNLTYDRYPLIKGQGNFGSIKGDKPAAERYIECKLSKLSAPHFSCIPVMSTVQNYSDEFQEPMILSTRLPILLMNGAGMTAVGFVTNIPSHNLTELAQALEYTARNWKTVTTSGILEFLKGPDFARGGVLLSTREELLSMYEAGFGRLRFSCDYKIEPSSRIQNVTDIVVHGIPDCFKLKQFIEKRVIQFKLSRTIVGYSENYNEKTGDFQMVLSVDNQASLKKVVAALQCTATYRFNVTERKSDDETETEFMEHVPLLTLMKKWLMWRRGEEEKMSKLELKKLSEAKFREDCKLLAMMNIKVLLASVEQVKIDPVDYVMQALKVSKVVAEELLNFRVRELRRLDEAALRKKIAEIAADVLRVQKDLTQPMAVVVRHLRRIVEEHGDARRTRTSGRLQDERKMQQTGDPLVFAVTVDGKLLGSIDEKGTSVSRILAVPSYEGYAAFGASGVVGFYGAADQGKDGVGFDKVVGTASREAPYLISIGANGMYNKAEQDRDSNKTIPTFLKDTEIVFACGAWEDDVVIVWDENGSSKCIKVTDLKCMRKNVKGVRFPFNGRRIVNAVHVRSNQTLLTDDGRTLSVRAATGSGVIFFACGERNLGVYRTGRRKVLTLGEVRAELQRGTLVAVYDVTLPKAGA